MSDELKGIKKYYYDSEVLENVYCNNNNCHSCDGTDMNGEPNGYGCDAREDWVVEQIESEKYEEITGDFDNLYVRLSDVEDLISKPKHETVEQWEARTGETYPDDGPVNVRYRVYEGIQPNSVNEVEWTEWMWTIMYWSDYENLSSIFESEYLDWEIEEPYVANHHGKPHNIEGE